MNPENQFAEQLTGARHPVRRRRKVVSANLGVGHLPDPVGPVVECERGEGFNFEWTPLTDGFKSAIKELPKIAEREIGPLEKSLADDLAKLGDQMVTGWDQHFKDLPAMEAAFVTQGDPIAEIIAKQEALTQRRNSEVASAVPTAGNAKQQVFGSFSAAAIQAFGQGGGRPEEKIVDAVDRLRIDQEKQASRQLAAMREIGTLS